MATKFEIFAALHVPGNPLVLYNIWDVGSALAVVAADRCSVSCPRCAHNICSDSRLRFWFRCSFEPHVFQDLRLVVFLDWDGIGLPFLARPMPEALVPFTVRQEPQPDCFLVELE